MKKKEAIIDIWRESFSDSDEYLDMFFSKVYHDEDALVLKDNGEIVSSMLLQRYAMNFHGAVVPISYVCGAATRKSRRGTGCMCHLMHDALKNSYARGDVFSVLIPANEWLFHYYEKFGYSPACYINVERYTSEHTFRHSGGYGQVLDVGTDDAYAFFNDCMMRRNCCVQHTEEQYSQILMDNSVDGGAVIAVADNDGVIAAMAFAVPTDTSEVKVKDVLARDTDSRNAVLGFVHDTFPGSSITVWGWYHDVPGALLARGMVRVVDVRKALEIIAHQYPKMKGVFTIHDGCIESNNHTFRMRDGVVEVEDGRLVKPDYDIDIEVFSSLLFGNDETRTLLDFPAVRPFISLMLD